MLNCLYCLSWDFVLTVQLFDVLMSQPLVGPRAQSARDIKKETRKWQAGQVSQATSHDDKLDSIMFASEATIIVIAIIVIMLLLLVVVVFGSQKSCLIKQIHVVRCCVRCGQNHVKYYQ